MYYDVIDTQHALRVRRPNRVTGCVQAANDPSCATQHFDRQGVDWTILIRPSKTLLLALKTLHNKLQQEVVLSCVTVCLHTALDELRLPFRVSPHVENTCLTRTDEMMHFLSVSFLQFVVSRYLGCLHFSTTKAGRRYPPRHSNFHLQV